MQKKQKRTSPGAVEKWILANADYAADNCLPWPFSRIRGYGNLKWRDKMTYAHVVMCELIRGPAPSPEHQASHSCGHGQFGCVNPKHLFRKTPSENQLDKRQHGTAYRAGRHQKLTKFDVAAIRLLRGKMTQDEMAALFKVSRRNIGAVLSGRSWRDAA